MLEACPLGVVVLGDKEAPEVTAYLNSTHVVDIGELGGDDDTGADACWEVKVPSPLKKKWLAGQGSTAGGGNCQTVGAWYGFGSTEEPLRVDILGCKERGRKRDGPFVHTGPRAGKGWVKGQAGDYRDAASKDITIKIALVETLGGVAPHTRAIYRRHARRASAKGARDKTKYGTTRISTRSFYTHHMQRLTTAAVRLDAENIRRGVNGKKGDACAE